jgi:hypothetical protein
MGTLVCTSWCAPADLPDAVETTAAALGPTVAAEACAAASDLLFALSGRRWNGGGCERTVTLELAPPVRATGADQRRAVLGGGRGSGGRVVMDVQLPDYPVTEITEVLDADQVAFDPATIRLVNGRTLERLHEGVRVSWPGCEITVTYTWGQAPPDGGKAAAVEYATQLILGKAGDSACQLPRRVQSITRQQVTIALLDPGDYLDQGRTGVPSIDLWLAAVNPAGLKRRPAVWSPDVDRTTPRYQPTP